MKLHFSSIVGDNDLESIDVDFLSPLNQRKRWKLKNAKEIN